MKATAALLVILLTSASLLPVAAQQPRPDPRFGIVEAFVDSAAASEAGAGYSRVILRWDVIQPGGPADWKPANVPDPLIQAERDAGREVVGLLIGTPAWAAEATAGGHGAAGVDSRSVPRMEAWQAFVRRMAQHYRGRIGHWIIWNEPDVWDVGHPGSTWTGSEADYARLLKTAYLAIKGVDPALQVHVAGLTYFWDWSHGRRRFLDRLLDVIAADPEAAGHGYYFDAVVYHLYFKPAQTAAVLAETQQTLARHGITGKQIWINETNAPPSEDPLERPWSAPRFRITLEEQAAFIIQEFATAFAAGATRVEVYKLRNSADHPESIEPYGLLRGDGSRRPAFDAYRVATTYLRDFRSAYAQRVGEAVAVTFDRGDQTTTVLWTTGRQRVAVRVRAIAARATLVDERGQVTGLRATDGFYEVVLPPALCTQAADCFIGGAPRLLVEAGGPAGRPALIPALPATPQPPSPAVSPRPQRTHNPV